MKTTRPKRRELNNVSSSVVAKPALHLISDNKEQQTQKTQDANRAIPDKEKRRAVKSGPETPASVLKNEGSTKGFLSHA
ncbi:hypothetical protein AMEX_G27197 [Astyanax mexicanus]|uniref:Uncharacterized protein n=1 Tax=Astyanax mexicanus TaxID=7994 RepID=A0A8T2KS91_ASTMX|nr:hypothetical protein AMEX_G27197 [Astyanax mexicanus]